MRIPEARGPFSSGLFSLLVGMPGADAAAEADLYDRVAGRMPGAARVAGIGDVLDEDVQLTLFCLYELHYGGLEGVDDSWEWNPRLIGIRNLLEKPFEQWLRSEAGELIAAVERPGSGVPDSDGTAALLFGLAARDGGPSLSRHVAKKATEGQLREFVIHKSLYQLKEADPHTWAIPRLTGRAKAALVEIQADEYGGGNPERMHSALFAQTMRGLGLDDSYGAYIDGMPAVSLASVNAMSLFGLNRRLRGAIAGHLAMYEMTSSRPNQLYGNGFRRLGFGEDVTRYFDEHVEADAVHEQIAGRDLAGGLVEAEPDLLEDVLFGAAAVACLDALFARHVLDAWQDGRSSLRVPVPAAV
ncbi:iron-containing redox enzyme family protein [Arthrobacter sp. ISL-85]|uniref:iron-containing redox enzyme family protein n=1 Tax=Arthrobacter sp. ISL-85 TaxID=2819115 RepID=UPI001BE5F665|nr:iron-containing redox enzyme family protein [Arthrobacter sp. ISL-85]MBT2566944.1 iron-containing redox enzyme family protein [Arthrobacter sp. ISL-85]